MSVVLSKAIDIDPFILVRPPPTPTPAAAHAYQLDRQYAAAALLDM